jgi:pimeloyl-ACP methyl ester carboxylesterase
VHKPVLHFSHANGFPALAYESMLGELARRYRVGWIEAIGTDPRYPVTDGWPHLVRQLVEHIEREYRGQPVFGVGHSLGGYLTFMAASSRPDLFRAIVLLDAPVIGPVRASVLAATKRLGVVDRITPAAATRERRSSWASAEEAKAHFRSRALFRHFSDACLDDYVRHGLIEGRKGLRLLIEPAVEAGIYRTIPHDMGRYLRALRTPAAFIGGDRSDVVKRVGLASMRRKFVLRRVPGGHLFPFEHPREAAEAILWLIAALAPDLRAA